MRRTSASGWKRSRTVSRNAGSQTRSFSSLKYWKACSTSARSTPGERPGGCWGLSGSLTYTSAPLASSILPTQLDAVLGMPVTSSGPPGYLTCGR